MHDAVSLVQVVEKLLGKHRANSFDVLCVVLL